jgi:hypothetical protein
MEEGTVKYSTSKGITGTAEKVRVGNKIESVFTYLPGAGLLLLRRKSKNKFYAQEFFYTT